MVEYHGSWYATESAMMIDSLVISVTFTATPEQQIAGTRVVNRGLFLETNALPKTVVVSVSYQ
jgi:hypothetical protein